jgi:RNA polymerase sigma factor (TIGR02999 family)
MGGLQETQLLLTRWGDGDTLARDALVARLHPELEQIALARLRREQNSSLSTGDLINEAVMRLIAADPTALNGRAHVTALASKLMRNILVDHARGRLAGKRRHQAVELTTRVDGGAQSFDLIALNSALVRLGAIDEQLAELVDMRYFGGMSLAEVGEAIGASEATAKRRWMVARAWLADALANNPLDA